MSFTCLKDDSSQQKLEPKSFHCEKAVSRSSKRASMRLGLAVLIVRLDGLDGTDDGRRRRRNRRSGDVGAARRPSCCVKSLFTISLFLYAATRSTGLGLTFTPSCCSIRSSPGGHLHYAKRMKSNSHWRLTLPALPFLLIKKFFLTICVQCCVRDVKEGITVFNHFVGGKRGC